MKYRKLGQTGLEVSVLGFGGSSLGGAFREIDDGEGIRTVHTAIDHGINLIDTAPFYGLTGVDYVDFIPGARHGIRQRRTDRHRNHPRVA